METSASSFKLRANAPEGRKRFPISLLLITGIVPIIAGCGGSEPQSSSARARSEVLPYVEIIQSQSGTLPLVQRINGVIRARNEISIHAEISGIVEDVFVDNGDWVNAGEPLIRLNARQAEEQFRQSEAQVRMQQAGVEQAQARLSELESELNLTEQLARRDFISELEITRLRARVDISRADLRRAQAVVESAESTVEERLWQLSQTIVRSPVNGLVGRRNVEPGMRIDSSRQLFLIGDLKDVRAVVQLSEQMLSNIAVGQRAEIQVDAFPLRRFEGKVARFSPFVESGTFSSEASIDLDNTESLLRSGTYVTVDLFYGESELTTLVPNSALHEDPRSGRLGVFVATNLDREMGDGDRSGNWPERLNSEKGEFVFRPVIVHARGRSSSGIEGIRPGDWVVAVGHDLLARNSESQEALVRVMNWDQMISLQKLQDRDVLHSFMQRHQELGQAARGSGNE